MPRVVNNLIRCGSAPSASGPTADVHREQSRTGLLLSASRVSRRWQHESVDSGMHVFFVSWQTQNKSRLTFSEEALPLSRLTITGERMLTAPLKKDSPAIVFTSCCSPCVMLSLAGLAAPATTRFPNLRFRQSVSEIFFPGPIGTIGCRLSACTPFQHTFNTRAASATRVCYVCICAAPSSAVAIGVGSRRLRTHRRRHQAAA